MALQEAFFRMKICVFFELFYRVKAKQLSYTVALFFNIAIVLL